MVRYYVEGRDGQPGMPTSWRVIESHHRTRGCAKIAINRLMRDGWEKSRLRVRMVIDR